MTAKEVTRQLADEMAALVIERPEDTARSATGVLSSHPLSNDVQITNFSLLFHGVQLIEDTTLSLNCTSSFARSSSCPRYRWLWLARWLALALALARWLTCISHRAAPLL